ncbi:MAG: hypothetical protein HOQ24_04665 [Mycobacteriaceae bacterium]|nr:hypothetical protein [Mycobacteriaceae bacterium]
MTEPAHFAGAAVSRSGLISVETTETGLPLSISVDPSELGRDPEQLARDIVRLCRQAANRAKLMRRAALTEVGVGEDIMKRLGLPTADAVALQEAAEEDEIGYDPGSWLRTAYE